MRRLARTKTNEPSVPALPTTPDPQKCDPKPIRPLALPSPKRSITPEKIPPKPTTSVERARMSRLPEPVIATVEEIKEPEIVEVKSVSPPITRGPVSGYPDTKVPYTNRSRYLPFLNR